MIAIRFFLAGSILVGWNLARGQLRGNLPTLRQWRDSAIVGFLLLCGGNGLVAFAEQTVPTGIVALLVAVMPAWVALFARLFFRERLIPLVVAGLVVGFVGVGILIGPSLLTTNARTLDPVGVGAVILGPILWASGSLYSAHRADLPRIPTLASAAQMLSAGVLSLVIAWPLGEYPNLHLDRISTESALAMVYLVTIGSILGFGAYVWLLRVAPLSKVTTYAYVNPVVAFVLGAIVLDEPIAPTTVIAAAVIVVGVALIVTGRGRASDPHADEVVLAEAEGAGGAAPKPAS
jgi:drug/metabolite transporter (DMT)-like permease